MTTSSIRHSVLAYLLLALLAEALWLTALAPLKNRWDQHKSRTLELTARVKLVEQKALAAQQSSRQLQSTLESLLTAGSLSAIASPSEAGHVLQELAKQALESASATIIQLRPGTSLYSSWLAQSRLEISFRISPDRLESLLTSLSTKAPALHLETISLSRAMNASYPGQPLVLDASVTLAMWHMSESLPELTGSVTSPEPVPDPSTPAKKSSPVNGSARLAGLFDAAYRARLANPSQEYYRLSAITVSSDARMAVIADVLSGTTRRLREGEMLDAWKIAEITSAEVTLVHGERRETLVLQRK